MRTLCRAKFTLANNKVVMLEDSNINIILAYAGINLSENMAYEFYISLRPNAEKLIEVLKESDVIEIDRYFTDGSSMHNDIPYKKKDGRNEFQTSSTDEKGNYIINIKGPRPRP